MTTILLVEDNAVNREAMVRYLTRRGFSVAEAADGRAALDVMRATPPDLVLMDMSLPVMDGLEATRAIRADPGLSGLPVIMLTAHAYDADRTKSLAAGCDDFDTKPVDMKRLLGKIRALLPEESTA